MVRSIQTFFATMRVEEDIQRQYLKEEANMMLDSLCLVYSIFVLTALN